ncbi:MAG TPA: hypothetical protein VEZ11_04190 [Thermoanaerobaculia bacterium]|nr:hypothetical protein [Thermoanaerobaculia bacterium]
MTTDPPPPDYFLEIESHFAMRRNTPFILSAKDWALMTSWKEQGIPLAVVIEAIDQVFDKNETSGRRKVISSLSYCRHAIKELWSDRKDLYVGAHGETPEATVEPLLSALAGQIEALAPAAVRDSAMRIAREVRDLVQEKSVPKIEDRLIDLEHELVESILAALGEDEVAALCAEIAAALGDTSRLDEATRRRTEEANLRRLVRQRSGLPRLSLFS